MKVQGASLLDLNTNAQLVMFETALFTQKLFMMGHVTLPNFSIKWERDGIIFIKFVRAKFSFVFIRFETSQTALLTPNINSVDAIVNSRIVSVCFYPWIKDDTLFICMLLYNFIINTIHQFVQILFEVVNRNWFDLKKGLIFALKSNKNGRSSLIIIFIHAMIRAHLL